MAAGDGKSTDEIQRIVYDATASALKVLLSDSSGDALTVDDSTGAIATIEFEHHEVHDGYSFSCWYEQTVSDVNDQSIIAFKTPNTDTRIHLVYTVWSTLIGEASILEAPTITDNTGATLAVYNRDRNSATKSEVIDRSPATDVAGQATYFTELTMGEVTGGTEIAHAHMAEGGDKKAVGGETRGTQEWVLLKNTLYAFRVNSLTIEDNVCGLKLHWYENG